MMIWLKAFGIGLGIFGLMVGALYFRAYYDEMPEWVQKLFACVVCVGILTLIAWFVMYKGLGMR